MTKENKGLVTYKNDPVFARALPGWTNADWTRAYTDYADYVAAVALRQRSKGLNSSARQFEAMAETYRAAARNWAAPEVNLSAIQF